MNSYKKNFLSCGNEKYGNPRVIMQMKEFGRWIDGYPAININKSNNTTYSIIIINPYEVKSTFDIEINNLKIMESFSVSALSVKKINFFDISKKINGRGNFIFLEKEEQSYILSIMLLMILTLLAHWSIRIHLELSSLINQGFSI